MYLRKNPPIFIKYILITIYSLVYSVAITLFLNPNNLAPGGVSGVAILLNYIYSFPIGLLIFVINIPIMIIGVIKFGIRFLTSTIICVLLSSIFAQTLTLFEPLSTDRVVSSLAGGILLAFSIGSIFKLGSSTGGTDIIVMLIRDKWPYVPVGKIFLILDSIIIIISAFVYKDITAALYAAVTAYVSSVVLDKVMYGSDGAKLAFIISNYSNEISKTVLEELSIGITMLNGTGAYTNIKKQVLMCVMKKQILPKLEDIVLEMDPKAFMIITSVTDVYGESFKESIVKSIK